MSGYYSPSITESDVGRVGGALHQSGITAYNTRLFAQFKPKHSDNTTSASQNKPALKRQLVLSIFAALPRVGPLLPLPRPAPPLFGAPPRRAPPRAQLRLVYEDPAPGALARAALCLAAAERWAPAPAQRAFVAALQRHLLVGDGAEHVKAQQLWVSRPPQDGVDCNLGFMESYRYSKTCTLIP